MTTVNDADRQAAARLLRYDEWRDAQLWSNAVAGDATIIAEAFANHREAAERQALAVVPYETASLLKGGKTIVVEFDNCSNAGKFFKELQQRGAAVDTTP